MKPFGRISRDLKKVKIDVKDRKIISLLCENSRMPASEIAQKVLLSRDAVAYRIKRLQHENVLLNFFPVVNVSRFDYTTFEVYFLLNEKLKNQQTAFLNFLVNHPNTRSVLLYIDTWDVQWTFIAKNINQFDPVLTEVLTRFESVILEKEKLATIRRYRASTLPNYYSPSPRVIPKKKQAIDVHLDETDLRLLSLLTQNCRQSTYELGQQLHLSPDTVMYRIQKLLKGRYIKRFTPLFNLTNLGYTWYTFVINFNKFDLKDEKRLTEFVNQHPHIIEASKMFGSWDLRLVITTDSPQNYHNTVKEIKNTFADIIYSYQTWLANEELYFNPLPKIITDTHLPHTPSRKAAQRN